MMTRKWSRRTVLGTLGTAATADALGSPALSRASATGSEGNDEWPISQRLGSTHVAPGYTFTEDNVLNEGAKRLQEMGSEVIKIWFHYLDEKYAQHSDWPTSFDSLVEQAKHEYLRELFDRPFKTYILSTYSKEPGNYNHYFRDGVSTAQYEQEVEEFYEVSKYLLETYRGSGKEFILQPWQGDWGILSHEQRDQIRAHDIQSDDPEPTRTAIEGMIRWLNARQEGVERARSEIESDVRVLHAAEVNMVLRAMKGQRRVINEVVPETNVDLVSHNSYRELWQGWVAPNPNSEGMPPEVTPSEQVDLLYRALDYANEHTPGPSAYVQETLVDPKKNVFVGEYGFPAIPEDQIDDAERYSKLATDVSLNWGARWVVYWQLYGSDPDEGGHWLVRPDGSKTPTYRYFRNLTQKNVVPTPVEYVELRLEFDQLLNGRAFACSEMELRGRNSGRTKTYDVGTWLGEPIIWSGSFWIDEHDGRTSRWFGGNDGVTRIFVTKAAFDRAQTLRLHGRPREPGIGVTLRVNGETVDEVKLDENGWRDWSLSLASESTETTTTTSATTTSETPVTTRTSTGTTTSTNSPQTATSETASRSAMSSTSTIRTVNDGDTPGFGPLSALAGLGLVAFKQYQRSRDEE